MRVSSCRPTNYDSGLCSEVPGRAVDRLWRLLDSDGPAAMPEFQILLVEDSPADARAFQAALDEASTRAKLYWVATAAEAIDFLDRSGRFQDVQPVKLG